MQLVPEIAYSMRDHVRADGTVRFLAPNSLIAEAAVNYGCILVSDDTELRNEVNLGYPNGAITTDELLKIINTYFINKNV